MNVGQVIILVIICGLIAWLLIDTVIAVIKKVKKKKLEAKTKQDNTTNE